MSDHDELDRIEQSAAEWLAERGEGMSRRRRQEFTAWQASDPRHAAAVARLEAACALLEELPQVRSQLLPVFSFPGAEQEMSPRSAVRRWRWGWAAGAAAAFVVLAVLGWRLAFAPDATREYATSDGGYNRVVLADGSVVELNANTVLRVAFTAGERRVALEAGEAYFTVAHDVARPFVVRAAHLAVRAVGTAFNVRRGGEAVEVLVTEGRVQLGALAGAAVDVASPMTPVLATLGANERLAVPPPERKTAGPGHVPPVVERVSSEVLRASLAWQERKLVFANTPLREVVAQFNRRNRVQLVLGDALLAERPVGGTFAADNVEGFARLLETSGAITVERRGEWEIVLRPGAR
jgi:transmembrane sensor